MSSGRDQILDLSRQGCWQDSNDASKLCARYNPPFDDFAYESYSDWPLCRVRPGASEVYRLVVMPSFSGKEVYCVAIENETGDLWWETCEGLFGNRLHLRSVVSKSALEPLFAALESLQFWDLTSIPDDRMGLDGHTSTFEGIRGDRYRRLTRWSPKRPFSDLEQAFTELAGVERSWG